MQLFFAHAAAEVRLEPGDRGQAPRLRAGPVRSAPRRPRRRRGTRSGISSRQAGAGWQSSTAQLRRQGEAARSAAAERAVATGVGQDLGHVPVGVVVGEDRVVGVGRHPRRAEVAGGGEDRVFGVVGVADPVAAGIDAVRFPGRGQELHPADRAGRRGPHVGAEGALDAVDRGEDRGALGAEPVGIGCALVDRDQDRRHPGGGAAGARDRGDIEGFGRAQRRRRRATVRGRFARRRRFTPVRVPGRYRPRCRRCFRALPACSAGAASVAPSSSGAAVGAAGLAGWVGAGALALGAVVAAGGFHWAADAAGALSAAPTAAAASVLRSLPISPARP